jgi:hypothetical protein
MLLLSYILPLKMRTFVGKYPLFTIHIHRC